MDEPHVMVDLEAANGRLERDLADAREVIVATNEVLGALGRSTSELDLVFDTIIESARRLSQADGALLHLSAGTEFRLARSSGMPAGFAEHMAAHPLHIGHDSLAGRVALDRRPVQIPDVLADPQYGRQDAQRLAGYRTIVGAPMILDGDVVGVLQVWRAEVRVFDDRAISMLTSFAAAAAIAVRNLGLIRALAARSDELASKVDQLEALGAIGDAVSSSLDLDEVLATIVRHAVELSGTDGGSLMEFDESRGLFTVRTVHGTAEAVLDQLRQAPISLEDSFVGRAASEARPLQLPDMSTASLDPHLRVLHDDGWRSMVAIPMLREARIVGVLVVRRRRSGDFAPEICELLETFASQSALAIMNARLFSELGRKSSELEVASRHKSEFLASMSHELRTPLNAVIGFSEVLLDRMFGDINERQEDYLRDIWSSGKHLLQLLNEILDLSKVEAGRMELESNVFVLGEAIEYSVSMVRERAQRRGLRLDVQIGDLLGEVTADELRFKQVVLNLLSNAVKFTPEGGLVTVTATRAADAITVAVTDTGIGVEPDDRERIFESFQQGRRVGSDHARLTEREGTGLGLTLCRRIVGLMGGRIQLESEVGVGSTFSFTVPVIATPTPRASTLAPVPTSPSSATVLVIDDDKRSSELLTAVLEAARCSVEHAHDGEAGLEQARRHHPDAIVLDIRLPGMDGWDVLRNLKADETTRGIPVVVVSVVDEQARSVSLGAARHLVKPVSRKELLRTLSETGLQLEMADAGVGTKVGER